MINTNNPYVEKFKGIISSVAPTLLPPGVFSSVEGGIPEFGGLQRAKGKKLISFQLGAVWTIAQFGNKVVVQRDDGLEIYDLFVVIPGELNFVTDSLLVNVTDSAGIDVLTYANP